MANPQLRLHRLGQTEEQKQAFVRSQFELLGPDGQDCVGLDRFEAFARLKVRLL